MAPPTVPKKTLSETIPNLSAEPKKCDKSPSGTLAAFCSIQQNTAKTPLRNPPAFSFQLFGNFFTKRRPKIAQAETSDIETASEKLEKSSARD